MPPMEPRILPTTARVLHREIEGYHVFTSEDVYGLYLAHQDQALAFGDVGQAIALLLEANEGLSSTAEPLSDCMPCGITMFKIGSWDATSWSAVTSGGPARPGGGAPGNRG
jgi:hypothetical protein